MTFMAISYAKNVAAFAGNARAMVGPRPLTNVLGPASRITARNASRADLYLYTSC